MMLSAFRFIFHSLSADPGRQRQRVSAQTGFSAKLLH